MREVVHQGEEDGEWFLNAQKAVKGPFAMILVYGLLIGVIARYSSIANDMLTGVIAF